LKEIQDEMSGKTLRQDDLERIYDIDSELSRICYYQGSYEEATIFAEKALRGRKELFGAYDIGTLKIKGIWRTFSWNGELGIKQNGTKQ
jgi:hypothetical protein